jgi:hypothetical protein
LLPLRARAQTFDPVNPANSDDIDRVHLALPHRPDPSPFLIRGESGILHTVEDMPPSSPGKGKQVHVGDLPVAIFGRVS